MFHSSILNLMIFIQYSTSLEVTIPYLGTLSGSQPVTTRSNQTIYQFQGVPYGQSPSGSMRFKRPILIGPWYGILNVEQVGPPCPSVSVIDKLLVDYPQNDLEDCLSLSIYTKNVSSSHAVIAFISGNSTIQPPYSFLEEDIVVVVIQFRLEFLGFLSTQSDEIPGNAGLMDVILALEWIKLYIEHFGGNPNLVTLLGHSAGGALASNIIRSPSVPDGLFHRAIIQSPNHATRVDNNPMNRVMEVVKYTNCSANNTVTELNECFMNMSVLDLVQAYKDFSDNNVAGMLEYNGIRISENLGEPLITSDNNIVRNIPYMTGVTKYEGYQLLILYYKRFNISSNIMIEKTYEFLDEFTKIIGESDNAEILSEFLTSLLFTQDQMLDGNFIDMAPGLMDITGDIVTKVPTINLLQLQTHLYPNQSYLYAFNFETDYSVSDEDVGLVPVEMLRRPVHADELSTLFRESDNQLDLKMSEIMIEFWTSFAINGKPKSIHAPEWLPVIRFSGPYMQLNINCTIGDNFYDELAISKLVNQQMEQMVDEIEVESVLEAPQGKACKNVFQLVYWLSFVFIVLIFSNVLMNM